MMQSVVVINPGGALDPDQVRGRDELIQHCWGLLETRSIALLAPRRVGKTSMCRRMRARPPASVSTCWRDLEGFHSAAEFVAALFSDTEQLLSASKKWNYRGRRALEQLSGTTEIAGFKLGLPAQGLSQVLDGLLADLDERASGQGERLVLFWDEFPSFLNDLIDAERAAEATMILDRLRAARQTHAGLRMVLTGSVGLHLVLGRLRRAGYGGDPVNDVEKIIVPLLERKAALDLAIGLLASIPVEEAHVAAVAATMAEASEGHPFLLHRIAQQLKERGGRSTADVDATLAALLDDESDPLELSHFVHRLDRYFDERLHRAALALLDAVAVAPRGRDFDSLPAETGVAREALLQAVDVLRRDQYVVRDGARIAFRLEFLRRYWCLERMLEPATRGRGKR